MLVISVRLGLAQTSTDAIVRQFYPQSLVQEVDRQDLLRLYTFQPADLDGTGHADYLVCVYFNGFNDVLRVLRVKDGVGSVVTDATVLPRIGGHLGSVTLVDLDGDGKPEILLNIPGPRSSENWILKWSNGQLSLIPGTTKADSRGRPRTLLTSVELLDIDGDGLPEILSNTAGEARKPVTDVYKYVNGICVRLPEFVFRWRVARTTGEQDEYDTTFLVAAPGDYVLRVVNGDSRGSNQVTSGEIDLNDDTVVAKSELKKQNRLITVPVKLDAENEIYIALRGTPGGEITVSVSRVQ